MRYLGIDLGTKTAGIALSDKTGLIASFYDNLCYDNEEELLLKLKEIVLKEGVSKIVLGFPKNMNNSLGFRADDTMLFQDKLSKFLNMEVILEDERLTTKLAESVLIKADMSRKKRKKVIDGVSAVVILQSYLDKK